MAEGIPQRPFAPPAGATEVILVRHGASAHAFPDQPFPLLDGQSDPELAPEGEQQAQALVERLAAEPLAGLFVTPLRRTQQTAAPLADRTGLEPAVVPELVEIALGDFEGGEWRVRAGKRGDPLVARVFAEQRWDVIPNAEPLEQYTSRLRAGVEKVVAAAGPDAVVAAFSHGAAIAEICHQATDSRPFAFVTVDNASITRLVVLADGTWVLRSFNDTAHLLS
jgi:2,3-bisphosphoglycerate-dependent phosphoglycerate mutase